jgi:hypothetical protein
MPPVNSYLLFWDERRLSDTSIVATKYEAQTVTKWAIRRRGDCMSKKNGNFDYEPQPSSRDEKYFKEYRFDTPEEAATAYKKFHSANQ